MTKERLDEIIEDINKHNVVQSICGGMCSYDCEISELAEYTLDLQQRLECSLKSLIKSKEYKVAKEMGLNRKNSVLMKLESILKGEKDETN